MEVVDAGEHVLQSEAVVGDAVGGVLEGHGQVRSSEASEEGEHQRRQRTFSRSRPANQEQHKLRFAVCQLQEVVQGREKHQGQQREENDFRDGSRRQQPGQDGQVQPGGFLRHAVAVHLVGKAYGVFLIPGKQEHPPPVDLPPAGNGVDRLVLRMPRRGLGGVTHVLLGAFADLQNAVHPPQVREPVEGSQLGGVDFDLRQLPAAFVETNKGDSGFLFHTVILGDLSGDARREVTERLPLGLPPGKDPPLQAALVYPVAFAVHEV